MDDNDQFPASPLPAQIRHVFADEVLAGYTRPAVLGIGAQILDIQRDGSRFYILWSQPAESSTQKGETP